MTLKPAPTTIPLVLPAKVPAETPIKIGTKGTVGSLMMKEIEYFNKLEVRSQKRGLQPPEAAAKSKISQPKPKIDSVFITPKTKKRSNKFLPSICSAIDVANHNGPRFGSGFSYKTLKADVRRLQV